jgi:hypothetical protein
MALSHPHPQAFSVTSMNLNLFLYFDLLMLMDLYYMVIICVFVRMCVASDDMKAKCVNKRVLKKSKSTYFAWFFFSLSLNLFESFLSQSVSTLFIGLMRLNERESV